jgi:adenosine deaminase
MTNGVGARTVPHGGELLGPASVRECLETLSADRLGHGVRAIEDPRLLETIVERGVALEVCPASNVSLGVAATASDVPLRALYEAGARMALGADDPLLFGSRLTRQYELARVEHAFTDTELADLARQSIRASAAPDAIRNRLLAGVDDWERPAVP